MRLNFVNVLLRIIVLKYEYFTAFMVKEQTKTQ